MLVVVSDSHSTEGHRLRGRTLEAVREAELVAHAGDFMTESVLDAFVAESASFVGVYGNTDDDAVRERLPGARTFEYGGVRFALTHTRHGGTTGLTLFGRERGADVVVFGHTHRPLFDATGPVALLNPGSYNRPRGGRPSHAELDSDADGLRGRFCTPDGDVFETFHVSTR
ncbi:MAG: metallophosphoesterase [Halobacteriota archaeon]